MKSVNFFSVHPIIKDGSGLAGGYAKVPHNRRKSGVDQKPLHEILGSITMVLGRVSLLVVSFFIR